MCYQKKKKINKKIKIIIYNNSVYALVEWLILMAHKLVEGYFMTIWLQVRESCSSCVHIYIFCLALS